MCRGSRVKLPLYVILMILENNRNCNRFLAFRAVKKLPMRCAFGGSL